MSVEVKEQQKKIGVRKDKTQKDWDGTEPSLINAKTAVESLKRRDLDEVRNLFKPLRNN